ncbi:MAG TPA: GNAT family N-acetyltransferase [Mycobacteriales bacterium]|nr:GNAT family N-acetyltransferase [Mycobacteriales bacterium]
MDVLRITRDAATEADLRSLRACLAAVRRADLPADPPPGHVEVAERLHPAADREPRTWLARGDAGGQTAGVVTVWLFTDENSHLSKVDLQVRPDHRRHGLGRRLLAVATAEARAHGRQRTYAWVSNGSPGESFAVNAGARPVLDSTRRILRVAEVDWSTLDGCAAGAESRAGGYRLVRWVGGCPAELLQPFARLMAAMNDAPIGESGLRAVGWTGARVRRGEAYLTALGLRGYVLAAAEPNTGELAGMTAVHVSPDSPRAAQAETTVFRPHRGRGLGLWLKANMLRWLSAAEPGVTEYQTFNADDNRHMVAVNTRLGYRLEDTMRMWRLGAG